VSPQKRARIAFGSAVILLLLSGVIAYIEISRLLAAQQGVTHTHEVQAALASVNIVLGRARRAQIEYIDSGGVPDLLRDYEATVGQIPGTLRRVRELTADNPTQQANCTRLEDLVDRRISFGASSVELKKSGQSDLQKQSELTHQIVAMSAEIDSLLQQMDGVEQHLLNLRTSDSARLLHATLAILATAFALALALLLIHYRLLNAESRARQQAEASLRDLSGRLLKMQDDERRRIARELHDSAGQILAALSMKLTPLATEAGTPGPHSMKVIEESLGLVSELTMEVRTISLLLYPPLLDEVGLSSALRLYLDGFAERSKIKVDLDIPDDFGRLSQELETAIFRIVQESVTNIHRHSESAVARIRISRSGRDVRLEVEDKGKGIPLEKRSEMESTGLAGVGIRGMRERIRQLGGTLEIRSGRNALGTLILARLPIGKTVSTVMA
jgi:signal transduction histidine kinase